MKKITIVMVALLMLPASSVQADLVGLWHLDGDADDSSGHGNHGTIYGDSAFVPGMFAQALRFDGQGDYVNLTASNIILDSDTFTIEAWFRTSINHPPYGGTEGRLVNLARDSAGYSAVVLYVERDNIAVCYQSTTNSPLFQHLKYSVNYYDGYWHHIAVTYDGATYRLYYGGSMVASKVDTFAGFGSSPAYFATFNSSERFFSGDLDEVRIWDEALTILPSLVLVDIDIKPGSWPNAINLGSQGVIPVAILTTPEFDAATVDPAQVYLAGLGVAVRGKSNKLLASLEDVDGDGDLDLVVKIDTQNLAPGDWQDGPVQVTGKTYGGQDIAGEDDIIVVPPG